MIKKSHLAALIGASLFALPAMADQAAYLPEVDADRAVTLLQKTYTLKSFCAPCGDTHAQSMEVNSINKADVNYKGYWEVQINGEGVDLAYLYFPEKDKWRNVAITLDIPVKGVPEFIDQ